MELKRPKGWKIVENLRPRPQLAGRSPVFSAPPTAASERSESWNFRELLSDQKVHKSLGRRSSLLDFSLSFFWACVSVFSLRILPTWHVLLRFCPWFSMKPSAYPGPWSGEQGRLLDLIPGQPWPFSPAKQNGSCLSGYLNLWIGSCCCFDFICRRFPVWKPAWKRASFLAWRRQRRTLSCQTFQPLEGTTSGNSARHVIVDIFEI